jgi:hypothetical protein
MCPKQWALRAPLSSRSRNVQNCTWRCHHGNARARRSADGSDATARFSCAAASATPTLAYSHEHAPPAWQPSPPSWRKRSPSYAHKRPGQSLPAPGWRPDPSPDTRQMAPVRPKRSRSLSWQTVERPAVSACSLVAARLPAGHPSGHTCLDSGDFGESVGATERVKHGRPHRQRYGSKTVPRRGSLSLGTTPAEAEPSLSTRACGGDWCRPMD